MQGSGGGRVNLVFKVGETEKHIVEYSRDRFTRAVNIYVDGNIVLKSVFMSSTRNTRTYEMNVGEKEVHIVRIEVTRPKFLKGLRNSRYDIYVDNSHVQSFLAF